MRLIRDFHPARSGASIAQVSFSDNTGFGAVTQSESRGTAIFAPRGVVYRPSEGDRLLMLEVDGAQTCVGCLSIPDGIGPGEIKITSSGGAEAVFKNNGEIQLNGLIITKNGKIIEAGGGEA
ncbi:MAG: hypothetical protein FWG94_01690 [Oscillospiraceae bacterium]|nr:hypothetical protein [Oscillospiraceae bacterium]